MPGPARIVDRDRGYRRVMRSVGRAAARGRVNVTVGIHQEEGSEETSDGDTVAGVAAAQEFGTDQIPPRSFIAAWMDEDERWIQARLRRALREVLLGRATENQALQAVARDSLERMKDRMRAGLAPPLSEETTRRHGDSGPPLLDLIPALSAKVAGERV